MTVLCGNVKLMKNQNVLTEDDKFSEILKNIGYLEEQGKTVIVLAINKVPQLIISLEESHLAKEDSQIVVRYLKQIGMRVCMITGDNIHSAHKVAEHIGIPKEDVFSEAYPE